MTDFAATLRALNARSGSPQKSAPAVTPQLPITVNVEAPPAAEVTVNVPEPVPQAYRVRVTARDNNGLIAEFLVEPVQVI